MSEVSKPDVAEAWLKTQFNITEIISASESVEKATLLVLKAICRGMDWEVGEFWSLNQSGDALTLGAFHSEIPETSSLEVFNRNFTFEKGQGTPGYVWQTQEPLWSIDVRHEACFFRKQIAEGMGLHGSLAFPVAIAGEFLGTMVFFTYQTRLEEKIHARVLSDIGSQFAQFLLRKKCEQTLGEYLEKLKQSNRDLSEFARVASHDLREPLNTISSFLSLMGKKLDGNLDKQTAEYFVFVKDAASRMRNLIENLLIYARVDKTDPEPVNVELREVVDASLENLRDLIERREATIHVSDLPSGYGDPSRLSQLFQNLISNAIKYCDKNMPEVRIAAESTDREIVVSVSDNGPGIPEEFKKHVFLPFRRLHSTERIGGSGLGLTICKRIVESYGGQIWIENRSESWSGSRLVFTLPRLRSHAG